MNNIPIIKLEVERMKHTILTCLSDYQLRMDASIKAEIERVCESGELKRLIAEAVQDGIMTGVKKEIEDFYKWGKGAEAIRESVKKGLSKLSGD